MAELRFKQGAYKYYAPWLFKCHKLAASWYAKHNGVSQRFIPELAQFYWDSYIAKKLTQEAKWRGMSMYSPPVKLQKKQQKAYVLGCGSSINKISAGQWQEIGCHYSVGVNNFYIHDFVADAYFCEFVDNKPFKDLIHNYLLNDVRKAQAKKRLSGRYVLFRGDGTLDYTKSNLQFYITRKVKCTDISVLKNIVSPKFYFENPFLSHHISNLDTVIHHCVREGYKEIVLMGVDLTNDGYFWDDLDTQASRDAQHYLEDYNKQVKYKKDTNGHHATASQEVAQKLGKLTIVEYLSYINNKILLPAGIRLRVGNEKSLLANIIEVAEIYTNMSRH